ncbi:hypothetical protein DACRYDRAFT_91309 [Dacryopinax primogenitus]|uniref:Uncharacterized protein n=1 Tax=Dacryopinax primogenitus (strain DJM 731) TaxID=1858805 RepID=M5G258_DACPD|nr:uncharacterized protein DACRYDRAFT_91309 [Dacryopinax primogenitus]EJT97847.1 hypothetical protein DACRYDRAFT_91309 [Dacryopinax primogenitus]
MRKEHEEKMKAEMEKLEEMQKNQAWAAAVSNGMRAEMERQLYLQSRGINLVDYFSQHPDTGFPGYMQHQAAANRRQDVHWQGPRQGAPQSNQQKNEKKKSRKGDQYANYEQPGAEAGYSGYPWTDTTAGPPGPSEYATDWGNASHGLQPYGQDPAQKHKSKKGKKGQQEGADQRTGYSWQNGAAEGLSFGGHGQFFGHAQNPNDWGTPAGPALNSAQHIGWDEQAADGKNKGKKNKSSKKQRNWRDEQVDPYNAQGEGCGAWGSQMQNDHVQYDASGKNHEPSQSPGGWGGASHGDYGGFAADPSSGWPAEDQVAADAGKQTISKRGGPLKGILKLFRRGSKKQSGNYASNDWAGQSDWGAPNVQVQVETHTQAQKTDWSTWPAAGEPSGVQGGHASGYGGAAPNPGWPGSLTATGGGGWPTGATNQVQDPGWEQGGMSTHRGQDGGWVDLAAMAMSQNDGGHWSQAATSTHRGHQGRSWDQTANGHPPSMHHGQGGFMPQANGPPAQSLYRGGGGYGRSPMPGMRPALDPNGFLAAENEKWAARVPQNPTAKALMQGLQNGHSRQPAEHAYYRQQHESALEDSDPSDGHHDLEENIGDFLTRLEDPRSLDILSGDNRRVGRGIEREP